MVSVYINNEPTWDCNCILGDGWDLNTGPPDMIDKLGEFPNCFLLIET